MFPILQIPSPSVSIESALALFSAVMTSYFWLVRARKEKAHWQVYQLQNFRASLRRGDPEKGTKRLGLTQVDKCGVLIANHSIRQNSIVRFDCFLPYQEETIVGSWGYVDDDAPSWNVGPESAISLNLACFFDVPEDYEIPDDLKFRVEFIAVGGQRFGHNFALKAPDR